LQVARSKVKVALQFALSIGVGIVIFALNARSLLLKVVDFL